MQYNHGVGKNNFIVIDEGYFMHKRIIFRSMGHSDAIEKYIYKKIEKFDKFFKREPLPIYVDIVLEPHREKNFFKVDVRINSLHYHIAIQTEGSDMYSMIDEAVCKVSKDIVKRKEKFGHELRLSYV
jgi:ribosomal subunit interface protein